MKNILITGGSRGIGKAIALSLASPETTLYINYAGNTEKAEQTKQEVEEIGSRCVLVQADLQKENCAALIKQTVPEADILILNASLQYRKKWMDITIEEFDRQINCNLRSSLLLMQQYLPGMIKRGWGRVITIGSVQEAKPHPDMLVYSSSKAALTLMARSLALQVADTGVTINSVAPGVIDTDRNTDALSDPTYEAAVKAKIPMGYIGKPRDCAGIVTALCTDACQYITGQNIFADGGMSIR